MADDLTQSISGAPQPPPPLSGLQFGGMGFSGAGAGPDTGSISGSRIGGMQPGPGLDILSLLQQLTGGGDLTAGAAIPNLSLFGGIGQGQLGQAGGFGGIQGPTFQQAGQQGVAGQTAGQTSPGAGSADPLAIIQKLLGLGQKGTGLLGAIQNQGQTGAAGGGTQSGYETGTAAPPLLGLASPVVGDITGGLSGGQGDFTNILATNPLQGTAYGDFLNSLAQASGTQTGVADFATGGTVPMPGAGGYGTPAVGSGGGFDFGALGALLGGAGSGIGLGKSVQEGNVPAAVQNFYGLYNQLAPFISQQTGLPLPTVTSALPQVADMLGIGGFASGGGLGFGGASAAIGSTPALTQAGVTAADIAGMTGSELGSAVASGAIGEGAGAAAGLSAGAAGLVAAPIIAGIVMPLFDKNGPFGHLMGLDLLGKAKEVRGAQKDFAYAAPIAAQGLDLPQRAAPVLQGGNPTDIGNLLNQITMEISQGPAISKAMATPQAGPFKSGIPQSLPWLNTAYGNMINTYMQAMNQLAGAGAIQRGPDQVSQVIEDGMAIGGLTQNTPTYTAGGVPIQFFESPQQIQSFAQYDPQLLAQYQQLMAPYFG